ncbi:MAG: pilus assembly protein PilP [Myxococcota bacterium]
MNRALLRVGVTVVLGLVSGCGEEPAAAPPPTAVAKKKAAEAPAAPKAVDAIDYSYNPVGKRDPFRAPDLDVATSSNGTTAVEKVGCTEPLCLVDTDELTVVAVVSGDANPLAMVEDRAGVGHIVRRNSRIGKQGGKVTQILRDCIVVTSFISGGADGKPQANKQNMCVKTDAKSANPLDLLKNKEFSP